jgi:hypothetical protein
MSQILTVSSWRQKPIPFAVVRLLLVCQMVSGTNFQILLQIWSVVNYCKQRRLNQYQNKLVYSIGLSHHPQMMYWKTNGFALLEMPKVYPPSEALKMLASPLEVPGIPWSKALKMPPLEEWLWI